MRRRKHIDGVETEEEPRYPDHCRVARMAVRRSRRMPPQSRRGARPRHRPSNHIAGATWRPITAAISRRSALDEYKKLSSCPVVRRPSRRTWPMRSAAALGFPVSPNPAVAMAAAARSRLKTSCSAMTHSTASCLGDSADASSHRSRSRHPGGGRSATDRRLLPNKRH